MNTELRNKIDSLWEIFWTGGLTNPLEVIEQMTYLMFIRDLDDSDTQRAREAAMLGLPQRSLFADTVTIGDREIDGQQLRWSVFHDFPAGKMYATVQEFVFPFIKGLHADKSSAYSKYMDDAIFKLPTPLMLDRVVNAMDDIYATVEALHETDAKGDLYEYMLSKLQQSGTNGQFRTPRHIVRMMVELVAPTPDDVIADPACGTAGFLVEAGEYLKREHRDAVMFDREKKEHFQSGMFTGYDMDRTMLRISAMNMMTHGVTSPFIEYRDSLSDQNTDAGRYSLILANPPFKGSLSADTVSADLIKVCNTKKTELLFLALFLRMLRVGGRCACIVPDGVLFGSSKAHVQMRKALIDENRLEAVISMPSGVFKPYAGVSTAVLVFTKTGHGGTDDVWFYDMRADGFSLDDKRSPIADNDIPDIVARFRSLSGAARQLPQRRSQDASDVSVSSPLSLGEVPRRGGEGVLSVDCAACSSKRGAMEPSQALRASSPKEGAKEDAGGAGPLASPAGRGGASEASDGEGALSVSCTDSSLKVGAEDGGCAAEPLGSPAGGAGAQAPERARPRTAQSFLVPVQEIRDNGYDLSINKYKQTEYKPVEYPPTGEILAELRALEAEIQKGLEELEGMV